MKIRVAILEKDIYYLKRIVSAFNARYFDKMIIFSFTELEVAISTIEKEKIDVFLASDDFQIDIESLPKKCSFFYLVDSNNIETLNNQKVICKFQKADVIYKNILSAFSEVATKITGITKGEHITETIIFLSASGGVGSSTVAAACAVNFSRKGGKVLYINLEQFGKAEMFFSAEGQLNLSDIFYNIKSKKSNLSLKLESVVKQDMSGVYFFDSCKVALDLLGMHQEDYEILFQTLQSTGTYTHIVIDMNFNLGKTELSVLKNINKAVFISDGSLTSNTKFRRAKEAMDIYYGEDSKYSNYEKYLLYNKFSNKTSEYISETEFDNLGTICRYVGATEKQLVEQIAGLDVFEKLY